MSDGESLLGKLKSRHVVRAAIAHIIVAWLFVQIADVVLPYLGIVDEPVRWALVISVGTFPLTLFVAWLTDKGRPLPELLALVIVAGIAGWWAVSNLPDYVRDKTSLVVMPFAHGDIAANEGLSHALTQEISSLLMRSRSIDVISQESARSGALEGLGAVGIAESLNVGAVLSGSVTTRGETMRIELRLLSAAGDALWESVIENSIANMFVVQERIATEIESQLGAGENAIPVSQVAAERCWMPNDAEALRNYYTARYYLEVRSDSQQSRQQIANAITLYDNLLEEYPTFSDARSGLAWAIYRQKQWFPDAGLPDDEVGPQIRQLAERAYDDCATNGEALHMLPNRYDHENGWIGQYRQGVAFVDLEPHKTENLGRLAGHFRLTGLVDRALDTARRHVELNPLSVNAIKNLAAIEQYHGNLDVAVELYDRMAELGWQGPNFARQQSAANECAWDVDCMAERNLLWPALRENLDLLRTATREPSSEAELRESLDAAVAVYEKNPADTVNTLNMMACQVEHLAPVFFDLWEAFKRDSRTVRMNWYWPNAWVDACIDVWSDPRFRGYVEEAGFVEYWQEVGWPAFCRPDGGQFYCGRKPASGQPPGNGET
jgi:TolB-like protein